jgi:CBS domain-containing protein
MAEPVFVGPLHHAGDTLRLHQQSLMAVVENGILVGVVRRVALERADKGVAVADLMEKPVAVSWDATLEEFGLLAQGIEGNPVPVTDPEGRLVGALGLANP